MLTEYVFSPSSGETLGSVKVRVRLRQAHDVHVLRVFDRIFENQDRIVIEERTRMEILVNYYSLDIAVLMRVNLVLRLRVPFARADFQFVRLLPVSKRCSVRNRVQDNVCLLISTFLIFVIHSFCSSFFVHLLINISLYVHGSLYD